MIEEQLLRFFKEHSSSRGIVPVRGDVLSSRVGASREDVGIALDKLERAGLIRVLAPLPFLVVKLRSWSSKAPKPADSRAAAYSYSSPSSNESKDSYRPRDDALMREILDTLGETDPSTFEGAIKNFSPEVIRKALERVRRARSLRKTPTALFRYLLTKLS